MQPGRKARASVFVCAHTTHVAETVPQAGANDADWGAKMCCSGDSLPEHCTQCNLENWGIFFLLHGSQIHQYWTGTSFFRFMRGVFSNANDINLFKNIPMHEPRLQVPIQCREYEYDGQIKPTEFHPTFCGDKPCFGPATQSRFQLALPTLEKLCL